MITLQETLYYRLKVLEIAKAIRDSKNYTHIAEQSAQLMGAREIGPFIKQMLEAAHDHNKKLGLRKLQDGLRMQKKGKVV